MDMVKELAVVEGLERRSLFSVMPVSAALVYQQMPAGDEVKTVEAPREVKAAKKVVTPGVLAKKKAVKPPTLKGEWDGRWRVKSWPFRRTYDLDLNFYSISRDSKLAYGELDAGRSDFGGRWTGITYGKNGRFKYELRLHGDKVTLEGTISPNSRFAWGTLTIKWDYGGKTKGDFTLNKW